MSTVIRDTFPDTYAHLHAADAEVVRTGFYRPNLRLTVERVNGEAAKRRKLVEWLGQLAGAGIVFAADAKAVDELTDYLTDWGMPVAAHHATATEPRRTVGRVKAVIAETGSDPGVAPGHVWFVIHYHAPASLEAFVHDIGLAGRDGGPAESVLLYDPADQRAQRSAIGRPPDDKDVAAAYHALERFAEQPEPPTLDELAAASGVPKTRLRAGLHLLVWRGIARPEPGGRYRSVVPYLGRDALERAAWAYRDHQERDRADLGRMAAYAEDRGCRWQNLLDAFDADPLPGECGRCDGCE